MKRSMNIYKKVCMPLGKKGVILILCVTLTLWGCWEDDDEGRDGASLPDVLCDLDCLPDQDEGGFSVDSFQLDDLSPHVEDVGQGGLDGQTEDGLDGPIREDVSSNDLTREDEWSPSEEICDDHLDNDGDGRVDCLDLDCWQSPLCVQEECDTIEPGYCLIPAGAFLMGCAEDEYSCNFLRKEIVIEWSFLMKATEVTQGEWEALMEYNNSHFPFCGPDCPVTDVNWWEALVYCNRLSEAMGLEPCYELEGCQLTRDGLDCEGVETLGLSCEGYRLPVDMEWEYSARAGTDTPFYTGEMTNRSELDPNLDRAAWFLGNCWVSYEGCVDFTEDEGPTCGGTHPVRGKEPNGWGLYDMLGNAQEWVWNWWSGPDQEDPLGPELPLEGDEDRVLRGGGYGSVPHYCRAWSHSGRSPSTRPKDGGFRTARTWEP